MAAFDAAAAGAGPRAVSIEAGLGLREGRELRTFGTVTDKLLALADWLLGLGVTIARPTFMYMVSLAACAR